MTIKQKIWGIPQVTIVIFAVGMAIIYLASSRTYTLLQRTGGIHHPYLHNTQILSSDLKGIQEDFQNAVVINDKNAITMTRRKAEHFRHIGSVIAKLNGKKAISQKMLMQFDDYFIPAVSAASIMLGIKTCDAIPELEWMISALNKLGTL